MSTLPNDNSNDDQVDFSTVSADLRVESQFVLYSWNDLVLSRAMASATGVMSSKNTLDEESEEMEETTDVAMFYYGHPDIEKTRGYIHLYRTRNTFDLEDISTRMLVVLAIRATLGVDQLLMFIQEFLSDIQKLQILFEADSPFYMWFVLFFTEDKCRHFYKKLNGIPFSSLEPEHLCQCAFVKEISTQCKDSRNPSFTETEGAGGLQELPQCIICLERMEESVEGLLTAPCNHEFHLNCLKQYKSTDCPVCRYSLVPDAKTASECLQCGHSDDLWLCLICGFIGCGRYLNAHAVEHFEATNHTFAKQMESERVWDYARDQYVHRLIQNKTDGKMVEYTVEAPFSPAVPPNELDPTDVTGRTTENGQYFTVTSDEKLDSIQIEYSYLISSELEKQRMYYEEKLKHMEIEAKSKEMQLEGRLKGVMDEKAQLEKEVNQVVKGKNVLEKKFTDLKSKYDICEKTRKSQFQDVDEMNKCLLENQKELKAKILNLEKEKIEMEETNRDLMFTLSAQQRMNELSEGDKSELASGSIHLESSSSASVKPNGGAKSKRKPSKR